MTSRALKVTLASLALSGALLAGCSHSKKTQTPVTGSIPPAPTTTTTAKAMSTTTTTEAGATTTTTAMGASTTTTAAK